MGRLNDLLYLKRKLDDSVSILEKAFKGSKENADMIAKQLKDFLDVDMDSLLVRINDEYARNTHRSGFVHLYEFIDQENPEVFRIKFVSYPDIDKDHARSFFRKILRRKSIKERIQVLSQKHEIKFSIDPILDFY